MLSFTPAPCLPDESLNGYFLRLTEENFLASINALLQPTGVRFKSSYTDIELTAIAECHELDLNLLRQLASYSAVNGSFSDGYFLRKAVVPVCPVCLGESGHIRQAWHHELVTACPVHQVQLLHQCPECETPFELNRACVSTCRYGHQITEAAAVSADPANQFVAKVLMGQVNLQIDPASNAAVPDGADKFLLFLANLHLVESQRKGAAISLTRSVEINQAAYEIAQELHVRFRTFVQGKVRAANKLESSRFIQNLGSWYRVLNTEFASDCYAAIRAIAYGVIVEEADAPINRKMKQIGAELLGLKSTFTAAEAARLLGSSPDRIVSYVKTGKLPGKILNGKSVEFCLVDRLAVEAEQRAATGLIAGKDLLKTLCITRRVRERLLECGVLRRVSEVEKPLFAKGDYLLEDLQALIDRLAQGVRPKESAQSIGLDDINGNRYSSEQANRLYRLIFEGEIRAVAQRSTMHGLAAFRFDLEDLSSQLEEHKSLFEMTITDLTKLTRWKHEAIKSWIDDGLLPHRVDVQRDRRRILISVAQLVTFLSRHIVLADAAQQLGSKSVWLSQSFSRLGVVANGGCISRQGVQRGMLLATDALINAALDRAPERLRIPAAASANRSGLMPA